MTLSAYFAMIAKYIRLIDTYKNDVCGYNICERI